MMERLTDMVNAQDYFGTIQWVKNPHLGTIGMKLNHCIEDAAGTVIIRMDSDDQYAPDWVSKSVKALVGNNGNCTGLSKAYFQHGNDWYLYQQQENTQPYVCGATMCFYRSLWEVNRFRDTNHGEDLHFQTNAIVRPHNYIDGFTAILHGNNTSSHNTIGMKEFTKVIR